MTKRYLDKQAQCTTTSWSLRVDSKETLELQRVKWFRQRPCAHVLTACIAQNYRYFGFVIPYRKPNTLQSTASSGVRMCHIMNVHLLNTYQNYRVDNAWVVRRANHKDYILVFRWRELSLSDLSGYLPSWVDFHNFKETPVTSRLRSRVKTRVSNQSKKPVLWIHPIDVRVVNSYTIKLAINPHLPGLVCRQGTVCMSLWSKQYLGVHKVTGLCALGSNYLTVSAMPHAPGTELQALFTRRATEQTPFHAAERARLAGGSMAGRHKLVELELGCMTTPPTTVQLLECNGIPRIRFDTRKMTRKERRKRRVVGRQAMRPADAYVKSTRVYGAAGELLREFSSC